jgi:hypothetical protein
MAGSAGALFANADPFGTTLSKVASFCIQFRRLMTIWLVRRINRLGCA